jgi:hypothetical protein
MYNTHNSNNDMTGQETTPAQSSNAESTYTQKLWCPRLDNNDTATVMTRQAKRD